MRPERGDHPIADGIARRYRAALPVGGLLAPITNTVFGVLDGHTDDTLASALTLNPRPATDQRFEAIPLGEAGGRSS